MLAPVRLGVWIRCVSPKSRPPARRKSARQVPDELLVAVRGAQRGRRDRVALQWRDGAGELHFEVLSPAQSWPYLN